MESWHVLGEVGQAGHHLRFRGYLSLLMPVRIATGKLPDRRSPTIRYLGHCPEDFTSTLQITTSIMYGIVQSLSIVRNPITEHHAWLRRHGSGKRMSRVQQMDQGDQDKGVSQVQSRVQRKPKKRPRPGTSQGRGGQADKGRGRDYHRPGSSGGRLVTTLAALTVATIARRHS